jgi:transposase
VSRAKRHADLEDVRRQLRAMIESGRIDDALDLVIGLLIETRDSNTALAVRLHNALRALYGRKSEKVSSAQLELLLQALGADAPQAAQDAAAEAAAQSGEGDQQDGPIPPPAQPARPARGRGGRRPLPDHLEREVREIRVPDEFRRCPVCGADKKCIGHITSEILEFVAAHFKVIEERREKLACEPCEGQIVSAPSEKVMERGRPGPSLLATIVVSKFQDALPNYRQCQIFERAGVSLSPSTVGDWSAFAIDVLEPIARQIGQRIVGGLYMQADDTGLRVLDKRHPNGVKRGHIWAFVGGKLVAFRYAPDWKSDHPAEFLRGFTGYLQGDGYAGFPELLEAPEAEAPVVAALRRLGCGMHIRRKFEQAADAGDARGAIALAYFKKIYAVEEACKKEEVFFETRKLRRDERSLPVVDELYTWVHELHPGLVPGTSLYKATRYAINQEAAWRRCFSDGRFEIDNGEVERQLRRVALGRKNYLFAGSDKGAQRYAIAYTILGSCHMNLIDPQAYVSDVIERLQNGWLMSRIDELLPDAWVGPRRSHVPGRDGDLGLRVGSQPASVSSP